VTVHDPLFDDAELEALGLAPHAFGTEVDAAVLHTDHAEYAQLGTAELPGARVLIDGRHIHADAGGDMRIVTLGKPETPQAGAT
jgi:hypothetical protein